MPDRNASNVQAHVRKHVETGTPLFTDTYLGYRELAGEYEHAFVDHMERYVNGHVHSQGIENFWTLLKRGLIGAYVSVARRAPVPVLGRTHVHG